MENWLRNFIGAMPKAELHLHLDGSLRIKTALDLMGKDYGYRQMYEALVLEGAVPSPDALLKYFDLPCKLLQTPEALRRVAQELVEDKAGDQVKYCEIKFAPLLHLEKGMSPEEALQTVYAGIKEGMKNTGIHGEMVPVGLRSHSLEDNLRMLEAVERCGCPVNGADFAGYEKAYPNPLDQLKFFQQAQAMGLGVAFHCGEVPHNADLFMEAAKAIKPQRISHGATAIDNPALCRYLIEENITLDLCPTSNLQAGLFANYKSYPLEKLYEQGVPLTISTDDSTLSNITQSQELCHVLSASDLSVADIWKINLQALRASFAPEEVKTQLLKEFNIWATNIMELDDGK